MSQPERPDLETIAKGKGVPMLKNVARYALHVERERDEARGMLRQPENALRNLARLMRERDEAREWVEKMQQANVLTCVYCGHEYPPGEPSHGTETLTAHVMECPHHPMAALRRRVREVISAVNGSRCGILRCYVCKWSKGHAPACPLAALLAECAE